MGLPVLTGEMVVLRPVEARDADVVWEISQDPEARRLVGDTSTVTREESDRWCADPAVRSGRVDLAITAVGTDDMRGHIALESIDPTRRSASIKLVMRPGQRGLGYGGEAIGLVLAHAFGEPPEGLGLHRVGLEVLSINPRVRALYEGFGFQVEGRLREAHRDGEWFCDSIVMGLLEDEYRA